MQPASGRGDRHECPRNAKPSPAAGSTRTQHQRLLRDQSPGLHSAGSRRARRRDAQAVAAILPLFRVAHGTKRLHWTRLDPGLWVVDGAGVRFPVQLLCRPKRITAEKLMSNNQATLVTRTPVSAPQEPSVPLNRTGTAEEASGA